MARGVRRRGFGRHHRGWANSGAEAVRRGGGPSGGRPVKHRSPQGRVPGDYPSHLRLNLEGSRKGQIKSWVVKFLSEILPGDCFCAHSFYRFLIRPVRGYNAFSKTNLWRPLPIGRNVKCCNDGWNGNSPRRGTGLRTGRSKVSRYVSTGTLACPALHGKERSRARGEGGNGNFDTFSAVSNPWVGPSAFCHSISYAIIQEFTKDLYSRALGPF